MLCSVSRERRGDPAVKVVPATTNLRAAVDPRAVTKVGVQSAGHLREELGHVFIRQGTDVQCRFGFRRDDVGPEPAFENGRDDGGLLLE